MAQYFAFALTGGSETTALRWVTPVRAVADSLSTGLREWAGGTHCERRSL